MKSGPGPEHGSRQIRMFVRRASMHKHTVSPLSVGLSNRDHYTVQRVLITALLPADLYGQRVVIGWR